MDKKKCYLFLADSTMLVFRLSVVVVCNVMYCG